MERAFETEQPLKSRKNLKLLRYGIVVILVLFLAQLILYSLEVRKIRNHPSPELRNPQSGPFYEVND